MTIPEEVWRELSRLNHSEARAAISGARAEGWINVLSLGTDQILSFQPPLDPGETAAISLAKSIRADLLLIDEIKGRSAARIQGLRVAGLLGDLLYAKHHGIVISLEDEITRLKQAAGFFIKSDLEQYLLREAGER